MISQPERTTLENQGQKVDRSECKISIAENGYLFKTRSGWWVYNNEKDLIQAISDYLKVLRKEREGK